MEPYALFENVSGLSVEDQTFVSRFGRGPILPVSHNTVHEAFESIADTHPGAVAAIHGVKSITYLQLDLAANRLAHYLIASGLRPRQRVCDEALRHIFEDTEARFILCLPQYWDRVKQFANLNTIVLELGMNTGAFYSASRPGIPVTSDDGVYAMYTSGSCPLRRL